MILRKLLLLTSWGLSTFLAVAGFWQVGLWKVTIAVLVCAIAWIFVRRKFSSVCLAGSVTFAAAGLILGAAAPFMFFYAGFSLATWDLNSMDLSLSRNSPDQKSNLYQSRRLFALGFSLGAGFLIIFLGHLLRFQIPFIVMVLLLVLVFFSLNRIMRLLQQKD
jgi:nitrate reductase gamma subunit